MFPFRRQSMARNVRCKKWIRPFCMNELPQKQHTPRRRPCGPFMVHQWWVTYVDTCNNLALMFICFATAINASNDIHSLWTCSTSTLCTIAKILCLVLFVCCIAYDIEPLGCLTSCLAHDGGVMFAPHVCVHRQSSEPSAHNAKVNRYPRLK